MCSVPLIPSSSSPSFPCVDAADAIDAVPCCEGQLRQQSVSHVCGCCCCCLSQLTLLLSSVWVSVWVDRQSVVPPPHNSRRWLHHFDALWQEPHDKRFYSLVYVIIVVVTAAFGAIRVFLMAYGAFRASTTLFNRMVRGLIYTSSRFFDTNPLGRIMNRCVPRCRPCTVYLTCAWPA